MSDPAKYRTREEVQRMRDEKDPIESIRNKLLNENIYNEEEVNKIDKTIRQEISDKADKAINADVSNLDNIHTHVLL